MNTTSPAPKGDSNTLGALVVQARERASLVGAFDPRTLLPPNLDRPLARAVLKQLAEKCTELEAQGRLLWRLNPDSRRETLASLGAERRLAEVASVALVHATDVFGQQLAGAVLGQTVQADTLSVEALDELHTALQFVAPVAASSHSPDDIEALLTRRQSEASLDVVLPKKLIGRTSELKKLRMFVKSPITQAEDPAAIFRVTGIGGSGKSALLAALARELRGSDWSGVPVIWLDFDRASLATADTNSLFQELTRQLALYRPGFRQQLSEFRRETRRGTPVESYGYEANASANTVTWSLWRQMMGGVLPITEPIVLILDTFEEVLVHGKEEADRVIRWLSALAQEGGLAQLRTIISGRALEDGSGSRVLQESSTGHIVLGDLPRGAAGRLLSSYLRRADLDPAGFPVRALIDRLGGNPLLLKILARYLLEAGITGATDLLQGAGQTRFNSEFAQTFLYTRILKRIRTDDPDIERLAHPGLVLRRVTASIIERVLAQPCGLGHVNSARAQDLFEKLGRQVWLVERTSDRGVVRHRRDLRRTMLRAITAADQASAQRIHRRAAAYYRLKLDPFLSEREQYFESLYHRMFQTAQAKPLPRNLVRPFLRHLGEDLADLPVSCRARLKVDAGRVLTDEERASLDAEKEKEYVHVRNEMALRRGDTATETVDIAETISVPNSVPTSLRGADFDASQVIALHFASANLEGIWEQAEAAIDNFVQAASGNRKEPSVADFTESGLWRAGLAAIAMGREGEIEWMLRESTKHRLEWGRPLNPGRTDSISVGTALTMQFALLGVEPPSLQIADRYNSKSPIRTTERFRAYQLLELGRALQGGSQRDVMIDLELVCDLSQTLLDILERPSHGGRWPWKLSPGAAGFYAQLHEKRLDTQTLTLADIQISRSRELSISGPAPERTPQIDDAGLLRARVPELYPAIRGAARSLSLESLQAYAAVAQQRSRIWPVELSPGELGNALVHDRQRWTATLINVLDRCGLLFEFVTHFAESAPHDQAWAHLHMLCSKLDARFGNAQSTNRSWKPDLGVEKK